MSNFLWVEDFEGGAAKQTFNQVFNKWLSKYPIQSPIPDNPDELRNWLTDYGIYTELTFWDGYQFIKDSQRMELIDYIVLDIDLRVNDDEDGENQQLAAFLATWHNYQAVDDEIQDERNWKTATTELKKVAGYHLFVELVFRQGFPVDHILFSSNHGDQLESITSAFHAAKIESPNIYKKSNKEAAKWIARKAGDKYSRLRRGVICGCRWLKEEIDGGCIELGFNGFVPNREAELGQEESKGYLDALERLLPIKYPSQDERDVLYRVLLFAMVREWEKADPKKLGSKTHFADNYGTIMKLVRNWSVHSSIFDHLHEEDLAFFFVINMRAFFYFAKHGENANAIREYEAYILDLFEEPLSVDEMQQLIDRWSLPLSSTYQKAMALYEELSERKGGGDIRFRDLINKLRELRPQDPNRNGIGSDKLVQFLYQLFWFDPLFPKSQTNRKRGDAMVTFSKYEYKAGNGKKDHVFELARHIYRYSFKGI